MHAVTPTLAPPPLPFRLLLLLLPRAPGGGGGGQGRRGGARQYTQVGACTSLYTGGAGLDWLTGWAGHRYGSPTSCTACNAPPNPKL